MSCIDSVQRTIYVKYAFNIELYNKYLMVYNKYVVVNEFIFIIFSTIILH